MHVNQVSFARNNKDYPYYSVGANSDHERQSLTMPPFLFTQLKITQPIDPFQAITCKVLYAVALKRVLKIGLLP